MSGITVTIFVHCLAVWLALGVCQEILRGQDLSEFEVQIGRLIGDFQWQAALEVAQAGLEIYPENPKLMMAAGALHLQLGKLQEGERLIHRAISQQPEDPVLLKVLGELQFALGNHREAKTLLKKVLEKEPDDAEILFRLAQISNLVEADSEAQELIKRALQLDPENVAYHRFYAVVLDSLGRPEEAYDELKKAYHLNPRDARLLLRLGDKERTARRPEQALEYLELAVSADPENPLYAEVLGEICLELGMEGEAKELQEKALRLRSAFEDYSRSFQLAAQGKFLEAISMMEKAWDRNPEFLTGAMELAGLYQRTGQTERALALYREILERDPQRRSLREQVAWIYVDRGDLEQAVEELYKSDEISANALLLRGYQLQLDSDWEGALDHLRQASTQYPLDTGILRQISLCLDSLGRVEESLAYLEKAHRASPDDHQVVQQARSIRFEYALALESENRWDEALRLLDRLILEETRAEYYFHQGFCLQSLLRFEAAVRSFSKGLEIDASADWARINLSHSLYALGRYDESAREWEYLVEKSATPEYIYNLGLSRIRQWRQEEGWKLIRRAADSGYQPALRLLELSGQK